METLFGTVWGALLLAPPLGAVGGLALRRLPPARARAVYVGLGIVLALAAAVAWSPWSLRGVAADAWALAAGYLAYCTAAMAAVLRVRGRGERVLAGTVAGLPVVAGYLLGTLGVLGLAFVVGDYEPRSARALAPGLSCRTYGFGNATTAAGGTVVEVFAHPRWAPFLERSLFRRAYDYREYAVDRLTGPSEDGLGMFASVLAAVVSA